MGLMHYHATLGLRRMQRGRGYKTFTSTVVVFFFGIVKVDLILGYYIQDGCKPPRPRRHTLISSEINTQTRLADRRLIKLDILAQLGQRLGQLGSYIPAALCLIDLQ